jgi:hypothetical protein
MTTKLEDIVNSEKDESISIVSSQDWTQNTNQTQTQKGSCWTTKETGYTVFQ